MLHKFKLPFCYKGFLQGWIFVGQLVNSASNYLPNLFRRYRWVDSVVA